jgi:hypothetical protein
MKTLKLYFTLAMLLPWAIALFFLGESTFSQNLLLIYLGIFLSIPLFHLLGKESGHLFDFPKLFFLYFISLVTVIVVGGIFSLSEEIKFLDSVLTTTFVVYGILFIFLTLNLKK